MSFRDVMKVTLYALTGFFAAFGVGAFIDMASKIIGWG